MVESPATPEVPNGNAEGTYDLISVTTILAQISRFWLSTFDICSICNCVKKYRVGNTEIPVSFVHSYRICNEDD